MMSSWMRLSCPVALRCEFEKRRNPVVCQLLVVSPSFWFYFSWLLPSVPFSGNSSPNFITKTVNFKYTSRKCLPLAQNGLKGEMSVQDDWIFFPSTNSLYHVVNGSNNWDECQQKCLSLTSHLTSIHTLAENEFVSNLTAGYQKKNEEDTNIWIGIVLSKDGWKNADKTAVSYICSHSKNT